jgi:molybdopterin/thiamine biosynthesis adenylyltransferase
MPDAILNAIRAISTPAKFPDKSDYISISTDHVAKLAIKYDISAIKVEQTALKNDIIPERYARNLKTYTPKEQLKLLQSTVAVIGLGGLGGIVVEILARAGIGCLYLTDGDHFEDHNLNRQLNSTSDSIGTSKSLAAKNRLLKINPSLSIKAHSEFLNDKNAALLIESSDIVVDCLDNIKTRFILAKAAKKKNIPMVSAAVGGLYGQVTTIFPGDTTLSMIYGSLDASSSKGAEASLGCLPQIVLMIAALEASEVLKFLLERGQLLRNRLFVADLEDNTFETLMLS